MEKQLLFAAGFSGDVPKICYFNKLQPEGELGCKTDGVLESAHTLMKEREAELRYLSAAEVAGLAQKAIRDYAAHGDYWKTMGGPISVLLITRGGSRWLQNKPPEQPWLTKRDFINAYRNKKVRIILIPPTTEKQLEALFATDS